MNVIPEAIGNYMKASQELSRDLGKLQKQNGIMREALRFYASGDAHDSNDSWVEYYENGHTRLATGKRARAALKEVENEY